MAKRKTGKIERVIIDPRLVDGLFSGITNSHRGHAMFSNFETDMQRTRQD